MRENERRTWDRARARARARAWVRARVRVRVGVPGARARVRVGASVARVGWRERGAHCLALRGVRVGGDL